MKILGTISGSSLDGLDLALCDFSIKNDQIEWSLLKAETLEFSAEILDRLKRATNMSAKELFHLDADFAKYSAKAVLQFLGSDYEDISYVSSHGHTIYHHPEDGYTVQIGNGGIIASLSHIATIADYRTNDIALGGQGAPIAPIVEKYLFPGHRFHINFGGIANISIHQNDAIVSFDVCPCNQILNALSQKVGLPYDAGGQLAATGKINLQLLNEWSNMPYFHKTPPKSIDNSWVMRDFYDVLQRHELSTSDALATTVEFVAVQLAQVIHSYATGIDSSIMIAGGGAHNTYLIDTLKNKIEDLPISVSKPNDDIINSKEAILMALMGFLRVQKLPNCIPSVTGASRATIAGAIYLP